MPNDILVGISTYNDYEYLEMLLQSIRWYTYIEDHAFDLVVCDDGTRMRNAKEDPDNSNMLLLDPASVAMADKTKEVAAKYGATYIEHSRNLGIPSAWNSLANALGAQSKYIVILNNDIIVPPQWLEVAIHFLRENADNAQVGSCYWNPVNRVDKELMRTILPLIGHTAFTTEDLVSGKELDFTGHSHTEVQVGAGQGLGRVQCPCGCCFAFTRKVWDEVGRFNPDLTSFHEESVKSDRYMVVRDSRGDIHIDTVEDLFQRYADTLTTQDGKDYVFPRGLQSLSASISQDEDKVIQHHLTIKQTDALSYDGPSRSAVAQAQRQALKKLDTDLHVNLGEWDDIEYIVRHRTDKQMLSVRSKFGATVVTTDHSLITYEDGELVPTRAGEIGDRSLERVWEAPEVRGVEYVDLAQFVQEIPSVHYNEEYIWYENKNYKHAIDESHSFIRYVHVGTPEMDALCAVIGMYISEGSVANIQSKWNWVTSIVCGYDRLVSEKAKELMQWLTDAPIYVRKSSDSSGHADNFCATTGHRIIAIMFREMCGKGSRNKRIPSFVFHLPREHQLQVFNSMVDGDGYRPKELDYYTCTEEHKNKYFLYTTASRGLVADLSFLLCQFGEKFTVGYRKSVDAYWIRNATKFYGPRGIEPRVDEAEKSEYVYDLGTKNTHMFVDAEGLILVHNSDWGTRCSEKGRASFGVAYPRPYHTHGFTFSISPELHAGERMRASRKLYREIWQVPDNVEDYFGWTHQKFMSQIPPTKLKYLRPDYSQQPVEHTLHGGERVKLPKLVEFEEEF